LASATLFGHKTAGLLLKKAQCARCIVSRTTVCRAGLLFFHPNCRCGRGKGVAGELMKNIVMGGMLAQLGMAFVC